MEQYNRGDIIVCRKRFKTKDLDYIPNKKYVIANVNTESISVGTDRKDDYWKGFPKFAIKSDKNFFCRRICPGRKSCVDPVFKEYFFTIKESRKQKLTKLRKK